MSPCAINVRFFSHQSSALQAFLALAHLLRLAWPRAGVSRALAERAPMPFSGQPSCLCSSLLALTLYSLLFWEQLPTPPGLGTRPQLPTSRHHIAHTSAPQGTGWHTR